MKLIGTLIFGLLFLSLSCSDSPTDGDSGQILRDRTIHVPSEIGNLKAAVAAAKNGDSIVLAPGLYSGEDFANISFEGKTMIISCIQGPDSCTINLGGSEDSKRRAFEFSRSDPEVLIDGITFTGGYHGNGGVVNISSASPVFRNCIFIGNTGSVSGGAVWIKGSSSSPLFINCTFAGNGAQAGSVFFCIGGASPEIENCLITANTSNPIYISDQTSIPEITCSNIFGNELVDWDEDIIDQLGENGNISTDPGICGDLNNRYQLNPDSPLLPENSDCGVLIGAIGDICLIR